MECKQCKKEFKIDNPKNNNQKFCSVLCRNRFNYNKRGGAEYQRDYLYKKSLEDGKERIQCKICGRWYRQVGSHVVNTHKMTAREYREKFGYDVKKGQLPKDLKQLYGRQAIENGTSKNLKQGKKFWFEKGDKRAGSYIRSEETITRLKKLHLLTKKKKNVKTIQNRIR